MEVFAGDRPLRVVAFFSGSASSVRYVVDHAEAHGETVEVVGGFTDDPDCSGVEHCRDRDIPVETGDIRAFYDERDAPTSDMEVREAFDRRTRERIDRFDPDLVMLSGYMWILTAPVLEAYPVLNVHPADLRITDEDGERVYVGYEPVADAVRAGEPETRSSVHFVTPEVDAGPILVCSRAFPVNRDLVGTLETYGAEDALEDYVAAHQEWMKWDGDGPAYATALELVAEGHVEREGPDAWVEGDPAPVVLGEDPPGSAGTD